MMQPGQTGPRPPRIEIAEPPSPSEIASAREAASRLPKSLTEYFQRDIDICVENLVHLEAAAATLRERIRQLQELKCLAEANPIANQIFLMEQELADPSKALGRSK